MLQPLSTCIRDGSSEGHIAKLASRGLGQVFLPQGFQTCGTVVGMRPRREREGHMTNLGGDMTNLRGA